MYKKSGILFICNMVLKFGEVFTNFKTAENVWGVLMHTIYSNMIMVHNLSDAGTIQLIFI